MRLLVHDYSGHPFQVQLSRALAERSHEVLHIQCSSYQTGKGALTRRHDDPATLLLEAIDLGETFNRYSLAHRLRQELAYSAAFTDRAAWYAPDVILSSNDPLFAKLRASQWCQRTGTPWVFWLQDIYSVAMANYARRRLGPIGAALGQLFQAIERRLLHDAAMTVAITEDFRPLLRRWGVPDERCHVIENWAPLVELSLIPRDNEWARSHDLHRCRVLLYSGTLGLKHNPELLVAVADQVRHEPDVRVVVVSEGSGIEWLAREAEARNLDNLLLLPYQPYDRLPAVFASADVLLTLLERDAGVFSVPSKILSYLCAGRPILAAMPEANLGARTIHRAGAGIVVSPDDASGFVAAASALLDDPVLRRCYGERARAYAESAFDIDGIAARFESILAEAARGRTP